MSYILDGAGLDSPECRQLRLKTDANSVETDTNVPAIVLFDAVDAFIDYDGPEDNYRPHMILMGHPVGVQAELPYNISTLRYQSRHDKQLVAYRYDFTRENLTELAANGLFDKGFEPTKLAKTSRYELPCEISYAAFPPEPAAQEQDESNPPVIFASLQMGSLRCNDETSGYTIHEYFEPVPEPPMDEMLSKYELPAAARSLGSEFSFKDFDVTMVTPVVTKPAEVKTSVEKKPAETKAPVSENADKAVKQPPKPSKRKQTQEPAWMRKPPEKAVSEPEETVSESIPAPVQQSDNVGTPEPAPVQPVGRDMSGLELDGDREESVEDELI